MINVPLLVTVRRLRAEKHVLYEYQRMVHNNILTLHILSISINTECRI